MPHVKPVEDPKDCHRQCAQRIRSHIGTLDRKRRRHIRHQLPLERDQRRLHFGWQSRQGFELKLVLGISILVGGQDRRDQRIQALGASPTNHIHKLRKMRVEDIEQQRLFPIIVMIDQRF